MAKEKESESQETNEYPRINLQLRQDKALYAYLNQVCEEQHTGRGALAATLIENILDVARGQKPLKGTLLYTLIYESVDALATTTIVQAPVISTPKIEEEEDEEEEHTSSSSSHEIDTMARGLGGFDMRI